MNSAEFKHFKLHADSTLKGMTKDELISYIHMLHHNWEVCDDMLVSFRSANLVKYQYINTLERENDVLKSALDKTCEELSKTYVKTTCGENIKKCRENHCLGDACKYSRRLTKEEWKEELMKDETD